MKIGKILNLGAVVFAIAGGLNLGSTVLLGWNALNILLGAFPPAEQVVNVLAVLSILYLGYKALKGKKK